MKFVFFIILAINLFANENVAFLLNQRYACVNIGVFDKDKLVQVMTLDEAKKYPIRFYINDKNILHTDSDMSLKYGSNKTYLNDEYSIALFVENDKRYIIFTMIKPEPIISLYACIETSNWTINK